VAAVDSRTEIRDFLTTRRARITPERAGLPAYGGHRRVTGLRREEVALLAGVSVDYDTRLERVNLTQRYGMGVLSHSPLAGDVLDRVDDIVTPGVTVNPADNGWVSPYLRPAARRR
jgi:hypothetical protein